MNDPTPPVFEPPASDASIERPPSRPGRVERTPLPGGELPPVGDVFSKAMQEFMDDIGPYALAGLGQMLAIMPIVFLMVIAIYAGMFAMMFAMFAAMIGAVAVFPEEYAGVAIVLAELLTFGLMFVMIFGLASLMAAVIAPINASLVRAVRKHQRGEATLEFSAAFSTILVDIVPVVGVALMIGMATFAGAMMCYLPALIVAFFLAFASSLVALHRRGVFSALGTSFKHVSSHLGWHVQYFGIYFLVIMVGAYIPILGPMFGLAFHVRAYRTLFGDGEEAVVDLG